MASIRKRIWANAAGEPRIRWQVDYIDQGGTRRHRQFGTKKAADTYLTSARYEVAQGTHTAPSAKFTVRQAIDAWLEHGAAEGLDRMTLRTNSAVVRHHVAPILGPVKLARLTRPAVERFRDDLLAGRVPDGQKRSRVMARKALGALKAAIKEAQRVGLVAQNVAAEVKIGRGDRAEGRRRLEVGVDVPSPAEVRAMLGAVPDHWRPLFLTAVFTGLRASELRGLTWADVDLKARLIQVRRRADRWGTLGATKSSAGDRSIPLPPLVSNALREWRLACLPSELDLVFPSPSGRVLDHSTLSRRAFGAAQLAAGITSASRQPRYGPHSFRHFYASWLIDQGFGPKRVMALLGHASITMTFDVYGHLFDLNEADHDKLAAGELALVGG